MKLRVLYFHNGVMRDLAGGLQSVEIGGDTAQAFRTCSIALNNTRDGRRYAIPFKNGGELRVHYGDIEFFRGVIFESSIDAKGAQSLKAHDANVYLTKNNDTVRFVGKTATQIIATLCGKYGIPTGSLATTRHVIPKFIVRGKTLYEIAVLALTETQKATGKRYRLRNVAGKLELVEVTASVKHLTLENGRNIIDASYSESIEEVRTRVKLTGGDENKPVTVEVSSPSASKYGIMQHYEHNSDVKSVKQLKPLADALLAELSKPKQEFNVTVIGDIDVVSATSVLVNETMTGIKGAFYVAADSHKFEANGLHTMSLRLTRELELERIEYEAPEEPKPKKAKKKTAKQKAKEEEAAKK
ncbi:XkdQ/YqbQ family protein [Sporosarcina sp. SAFN-015]|uniref:XkdQ/YqbQ family protein n=1 Tax=Sporosarcina sp. SAFN-015 TaxID=3387274 RepID=UPI003F802800